MHSLSADIKKHFDYDVEVKHVVDRPFNDKRYAVNDNKLRDLGWEPKNNLIDDLPELIQWYRLNYDWFN